MVIFTSTAHSGDTVVPKMIVFLLFGSLSVALGGQSSDPKENYKDQYCTDPRTLQKHAAYSEWADAYSCTRHRCQPGGRNLAIYTVGCKRVEAPESAIECEEVVEDTNMQFPFCCTRLRCLVVVRGEVWTRVLGQPWETLPAAPWSHMYKMKKPPPKESPFVSKTPEGPVYELVDPEGDSGRDKVLRSGKKATTDSPDCNELVPRAAPPPPDIVIALTTDSEQQKHTHISKKGDSGRHKRGRKSQPGPQYVEEEREPHHEARDREPRDPEANEVEDAVTTEKPVVEASEERFFANTFTGTQKEPSKNEHQVTWTEIPQNQWNEPLPDVNKDSVYQQQQEAQPAEAEKKDENRPPNLQSLVDAIGTRMRDIESVVQRMSEKVHHGKPAVVEYVSSEKRAPSEGEQPSHAHHKSDNKEPKEAPKKRPNPDGEHYKRFSVRSRGSKYLRTSADTTTDQPLFVEDANLGNGYYSDASNSLLRRANSPKEPAASMFMAPVETRRKSPAHMVVTDVSEDEKKHKKHGHKKRKNKTGRHKKHHKDDKKKHFSKFSSVEVDRNVVSLEDSSAIATK